MYFELFRASVQAAQLLQAAQQQAEKQLLEADLPPIRLEQTEQTDEESFSSVSVLALSVTFGASSPKGRALGKTGNFTVLPKPPALRKDFPRSGEDAA